ncbi:ABC transporter ATP-binding protein [Paenibacillus sp. SN-8-1]|uniref:ABC transporter ATP-binding protein n=1 Tax=Paenibacillus sp. SN-8-1 TaxID=3435409 RepID=UPI003D9A5C80
MRLWARKRPIDEASEAEKDSLSTSTLVSDSGPDIVKLHDNLVDSEILDSTRSEPYKEEIEQASNPVLIHKSSEPILEVKDVHRSFQVGGQSLHVLKGIQMEVLPGQLVMLKGRSGSGKTTLLNMLGGLDQPTEGEIYFRGQTLHTLSDKRRTVLRRDQIGFIFQAYALLPLLSAWENVELSLRMASVPSREWKERVAHCLNLVGLGKRMHHRPFELSGGEQQRVAIAKAIAHRPHLLLADEPTANLDSQMGAQVMAVFRNIIETENVTICMTTHDPTILEVADHVYEMVDGKFI